MIIIVIISICRITIMVINLQSAHLGCGIIIII